MASLSTMAKLCVPRAAGCGQEQGAAFGGLAGRPAAVPGALVMKKRSTSAAARRGASAVRHVAMQDSMSGMDADDLDAGLGENEYPPGMVRYESMVVLRPDVTDEERVALTQRYEEFLVAGGAMFVEMFNRGMQPLAYNIKTKNMGGVLSRYLDGIYLLFMYVTKPESQKSLQEKLNADDDVIRSTTFRLKL